MAQPKCHLGKRKVREMSQEGINIINNEQNLCSPVCPVLESQEYGGLERIQRGVCVYVCVKQKGVWMNHRETGIDEVSQRACPSTSSQTLLEMIFMVVHLCKPCHDCRQ